MFNKLHPPRRITLLGLVSALCAAPIALGQTEAKTENGPAGLAGFNDAGRFHLIKNKETIAEINFTWKPDGTFDNTCVISIAGQKIVTHSVVTPDADGVWKRIDVETAAGKASLERDGLSVKRTNDDKVNEFELKPSAVLFDNVAPALTSHMLMNYDQQRGGSQLTTLVIVPNVMFEAPLERLDEVERTIGGRSMRFTRYKLAFPGVDITIWADAEHKVYLQDIPAQFAAFVRDGYEALLEPPADDKLSEPKYEIRKDENMRTPMRDGVELAMDVYRPDVEGRFPVILVRTPYKKEMNELQARYFARRGYVYAVQDCRGRFASAGDWEPFVNEAEDGYDTIEWLAEQSWSTGKVGMIGASYLGWVQWWAASRNPPHLVTIIPSVSPPDPCGNFPSEGGVFFLWGAAFWMDVVETNATADLSGGALQTIANKNYGQLLKELPVIDLDKTLLGEENAYWRKWIENGPESDYWTKANFLDRMKTVPIPVFHQSGWFDGDGVGTKINYARMKSYGHPNQKLVLGPWEHTDTATRVARDRDFTDAAIVDMQQRYLRWFDYWLKDVDNGIMDEPLVDIFVMGSNCWLHADAYPLPVTRFEKWYLSSGGQANTAKGDGLLSQNIPSADCPPDRYAYDPADPTPDPTYLEADKDGDASGHAAREAHYKQVVSRRDDILVYTSAPLAEPLTIAGPLEVVLHAATSARDTDWFARVYEVDEQENAFALTPLGGKIRARYRNSLHQAELLKPEEIGEYNIDLWQTAITIPAGRRLRVEIASADFPLFSRNLNTGGANEMDEEYVTAEQTIFHNDAHRSHILLPVIPAAELAKAQARQSR